jgi:hypothetical protein
MSSRGGAPPEIAVASLYKENLVTRHTGRAVRLSIEGMVAELGRHSLTILDFRDVGIIDFSCADEIVAKLMLRTLSPARSAGKTFFLFRGIDEHHRDPVECALKRRGLAAPAENARGEPLLIGEAGADAHRAWNEVCREGRAAVGTLASRLGMDENSCGCLLETLHEKRLIRREGEDYLSLFHAFSEAERASQAGASGNGDSTADVEP